MAGQMINYFTFNYFDDDLRVKINAKWAITIDEFTNKVLVGNQINML